MVRKMKVGINLDSLKGNIEDWGNQRRIKEIALKRLKHFISK